MAPLVHDVSSSKSVSILSCWSRISASSWWISSVSWLRLTSNSSAVIISSLAGAVASPARSLLDNPGDMFLLFGSAVFFRPRRTNYGHPKKITNSIDEKILLVDSLAAPFFEILEYPCGHYGEQLVFLESISTRDDSRSSHNTR